MSHGSSILLPGASRQFTHQYFYSLNNIKRHKHSQRNNTISYDEVFLERDVWCIGNMSRKIGQALVARDFTRNVVCQGLQFTKELIYLAS